MKITTLILLFLLVACVPDPGSKNDYYLNIGLELASNNTKLNSTTDPGFDIGSELTRLSELMNLSVPVMIDSKTKLEKSYSHMNVIRFEYALHDLGLEGFNINGMRNILRARVVKGNCADPVVRELISNGAIFEHVYNHIDGELVGKVVVDDASCVVETGDSEIFSISEKSISSHDKDKSVLVSTSVVKAERDNKAFPNWYIVFTDTDDKYVKALDFSPEEYLVVKNEIQKGVVESTTYDLYVEFIDPGQNATNFKMVFYYPGEEGTKIWAEDKSLGDLIEHLLSKLNI